MTAHFALAWVALAGVGAAPAGAPVEAPSGPVELGAGPRAAADAPPEDPAAALQRQLAAAAQTDAEPGFMDELQYEFIVRSTVRWQVDNGESSEFFNSLTGDEPRCTVNEDCGAGAVCFEGRCRVPNQQFDPSGENFGDWVTTFGGSARWREFAAVARFDSALYVRPPRPAPGASRFIQDRLSQRYEDQLQPEFLAFTYSGRDVELTLGDYYVTLGRGMTLGVRIVDEVGVDNKLRGGEAKAHVGPAELHVFYGFLNIKNYEPGTGFAYRDTNDRMGGARIAYGFGRFLKLGAHLASIQTPRIDEVVSEASAELGGPRTEFLNVGATVELPRPTDWSSAYLEVALLNRDRFETEGGRERFEEQRGFGLYGNVNLYFGPLTFLLEGKAYDNMLNILPGNAETDLAQRRQNINRLSEPPTAERFGATIQTNNTVYGGRLRADWALTPRIVPYVSFGHYEEGGCGLLGLRGEAGTSGDAECVDQGVAPSNSDTPVSADPKSFINSVFAGLRARWDGGDVSAEGGYRGQFFYFDQLGTASGLSQLVFQETHGQADVHQRFGDYTGEVFVQGKVLNDLGNEWEELRVALTFGSDQGWSLTGAYEYTNISPNSREHYPSISGQWQVDESILLRALVGGERPGLKCSGGACRLFPGFEGGRLELSARF